MTTTTDSAVLPASPAFSVLAAATATHGTGRDGDIALPKLPGFVESAFSPLAYEVAARCLTACPGDGDRTAVALVSLAGDTTTADLASSRMVSGRVHNPLLFMQATANSVLGHMSREFGITGQMFSLSTLADPLTELLAMAELLLEEPELDRVLVLGVELGGGERVAAVHRELAAEYAEYSARPVPVLPASAGLAAAVLLGRPGDSGAPQVPVRPTATTTGRLGSIQTLFELAATHTETRESHTHAHQ
uniref:Beta-ketoacyl synthase N-terminal domain-containing protein n=1 Tax=Streptomyces sp. NBC_00093 TaxID=2975649 RepID=A0AAU2A2R9_9ACTN